MRQTVHPDDLIEVDGSMEGAREVQSFLKSMPSHGDVRAVFVDGAKFSDAAQDAYLKICEDDSSFSSIIFAVDDFDSIRPALASRLDEIKVFAEFEDSDDWVKSVSRGRVEITNAMESNLQKLQNFNSELIEVCSGKKILESVPAVILEWQDLEDNMKHAVLAVCEHAAKRHVGPGSVNVLKFVNSMLSISSANAEIHWWRIHVV